MDRKTASKDKRDAVGDDTPETEMPYGLQRTREVAVDDVDRDEDEDEDSESFSPLQTSRPDTGDDEAQGDRQADERAELEEIEPDLGRQR